MGRKIKVIEEIRDTLAEIRDLMKAQDLRISEASAKGKDAEKALQGFLDSLAPGIRMMFPRPVPKKED